MQSDNVQLQIIILICQLIINIYIQQKMKLTQALIIVFLLFSCLHFKKIQLSHLRKDSTPRNLQILSDPAQPIPLLTAQPAAHQQWRTQLLDQVVSIPKLGTPGQAIVFGNNAAVIVAGDNICDVLMTAAELEQGRVFLATQSGYLDNFINENSTDINIRTLHKNLKKWITKGTSTSNVEFMDVSLFIKNTTNTTGIKAIYFKQSTSTFTTDNKNKVLNFVKNGGGLIVGITPWGWAQLKGTNDFTQLLTYSTFLAAGITFNEEYIWGSPTFNPTQANVSLSHLGLAIGLTLSPFNSSTNYSKTKDIVRQVKYLPETQKAKIQILVQSYISDTQITGIVPTKAKPLTVGQIYQKARITLYQYIVLRGVPGKIAPGLSNFPFDINRSSYTLTSNTFTFSGLGYNQYYHTGYYAVAGETITINVIGSIPANWEVTIGFHYDDNSGQDSWIRWPTVYLSTKVNTQSISFTSPFGGLVIFKSPATNTTLQVNLSNVLEAPFFDSQNPSSVSDWSRRKTTLGAWGCAKGLYVGFCIPGTAFQNVQDPTSVLNFYDQIYLAYHDLRGTNASLQRKQWLSSDIKPSVGYMHSGYPVVTELDVGTPSYSQFLFNYTSLTTSGQWGVFHEFGHNMQRSAWTYDGTGQVSNNVFSLKATQLVIGTSPKNAPWLIGQKKSALNYLKAPNFTTWKNSPGVALMIYVQVIEDFGWDVLKGVFTSYETAASNTLPSVNQDKIDTFWAKVSLGAGVNLSLLLDKWGIPYTVNFTNQVSSLPAYTEKVNLFV